MRSGLVTGLVLAAAALTFILAYRQHMQGNFHKLKQRMADERPQEAIPMPGGQEAIELTRARLMEDAAPEFLSATLLPGRGMDVLQIRAFVPGTGEMDLLASPALRQVAAMNGRGADTEGRLSLTAGGAFEVPWADRIPSATSDAYDGTRIEWRGQPIALPNLPAEEGGMMLATPSDSSSVSLLPDGGQTEATFSAFGEPWPSAMEVKVAALLSSHTIDLTVTARNTGSTEEPMAIGWRPRFAIQGGAQLLLHLPAESVVEEAGRHGLLPTGRLTPVAHTAFDYTSESGAPLPRDGMDLCFAELQQGVMDDGPAAELIDAMDGYKLRLTALSPEIKAMRVTMPRDAGYISIGPQFNYPDPFGHEWEKTGGAGMVVLQPGQSTQWKVRLEILPLHEHPAAR